MHNSTAPRNLHSRGQGAKETVRKQNSEERPDEGGTDFMPDLLNGAVDGTHRDHDSQHRRDDAETGQGVRRLRQNRHRRVVLFLDDFELGVQQTGQLFGRGSIDERRETVADEFNDVMVVGDLGYLLMISL